MAMLATEKRLMKQKSVRRCILKTYDLDVETVYFATETEPVQRWSALNCRLIPKDMD